MSVHEVRFWPIWAIFDRTPDGRDADGRPELDYS
jgi:hypothetical protein